MVSPRAVVVDTPAELGEQDHQQVLAGLVLLQVVKEALHRLGDFGPQLGVSRKLHGMGVEAAVLTVEHLRTHLGQVSLSNALEGAGYRGGSVLHGGGVLLGRNLKNVCPFKGVQTGLAQVVHDRSPPYGGGVHPGKVIQGPCSLFLTSYTGQKPVGLQVGDRCYGYPGERQSSGQALAEVYRLDHVLVVGVQVPHGAPQPPLGAYLVWLAGMPDVHGPEMGAGRVIESDAVDNGHPPLVVNALHGPHVGMEAQSVVDADHLVLGDSHVGPVVVVDGVGIGHQAVQVVVSPGKL